MRVGTCDGTASHRRGTGENRATRDRRVWRDRNRCFLIADSIATPSYRERNSLAPEDDNNALLKCLIYVGVWSSSV